jgi:glyoxylase-like metal-dependent hydrolase (beta-lactamase superfamily II)
MAEEVLPGVYAIKIRMGYVNAFLLTGGDGLTLIDSGLPGQVRTLLSAVERIGQKPADLKHIAVTHHHVDHTGSLADLVQATQARVYVHPLDAPITKGEQPVPGPNPASMLGKLLWPLLKRLTPARLEPIAIDHEVSDGEELPLAGGLKAVHTPGHTAGHVSYLRPGNGGVLFVGDAAGHMLGRLGPPAGMFTEDPAQVKASLRKIAELEFDAACFGHGGVLKGRASAAFRRYVEKMAR